MKHLLIRVSVSAVIVVSFALHSLDHRRPDQHRGGQQRDDGALKQEDGDRVILLTKVVAGNLTAMMLVVMLLVSCLATSGEREAVPKKGERSGVVEDN